MGEIVEFMPEHIGLIVPMEFQECKGIEGWGSSNREQLLAQAMSGPAFSYCSDDGKILAISGATLFWPGVGWGWAIIDRMAFQDSVGLVHAFMRGIDLLFKLGAFHRIQTTVRADYDRGLRLAHVLGFTDDICRLKKFDRDGSDHILFAKLAR